MSEDQTITKILNTPETDQPGKVELIKEHYEEREQRIVSIFIIVWFISLCAVYYLNN